MYNFTTAHSKWYCARSSNSSYRIRKKVIKQNAEQSKREHAIPIIEYRGKETATVDTASVARKNVCVANSSSTINGMSGKKCC